MDEQVQLQISLVQFKQAYGSAGVQMVKSLEKEPFMDWALGFTTLVVKWLDYMINKHACRYLECVGHDEHKLVSVDCFDFCVPITLLTSGSSPLEKQVGCLACNRIQKKALVVTFQAGR